MPPVIRWKKRRAGGGAPDTPLDRSVAKLLEDARTSTAEARAEGTPAAEPQRWLCFIDRVDRNVVSGWCCDTHNPDDDLTIEVVASNNRRAIYTASLHREDVQAAGFGSGHHGFDIDLKEFELRDEDTIKIRVFENKIELTPQPISTSPVRSLLANPLPPSFVDRLFPLASDILAADDERRRSGVADAGPREETPPGDEVIDRLFEPFDAETDPEGVISNYTAFECNRLVRDEFNFQMVGDIQERLAVLRWYLTIVAQHRQYRLALPLSKRQIAFLNRPAPIAGGSPSVTIIVQSMVLHERPDLSHLVDPEMVRRALYWWCVERAPRLRCEDSLVTPEQIMLLRQEIQWVGEDFPFNYFMARFFEDHRELHALDMNLPEHRAAFTYYILLRGFSQPHLLRLIPTSAFRQLLRRRADDVCFFDRISEHLVRGIGSLEEAQRLREAGEALAAHAGYGLHNALSSASRDRGEFARQKRRLDGPIETGVAVIGPFRQTSGLGQATRLSYDVLKTIEKKLPPTALSFELDNPAPIGFTSDQNLEPYRHRRAINLIHLNAESIPLVFAFEQREIFSRSYNIGYFFWELNEIPKCHRLALKLLDEVWVSSEYNREIYARFTDKPVVNVGMAVEPLPATTPLPRAALGLPDSAVVFLTTFDSFSFIERKNPLGVLKAFKTAFPAGTENVRLVIKTQNRTRVGDPYQIDMWRRIDREVAADPRIVVVNETYKYRDLLGLKLACDCYISLHRSEGWGFGMIEAMQLAKPVIATAYSGNMEFCTPETAFLVGYELQGVREAEYIFVERGSQWAAPHIEEAAQHMRAVAADLPAARAKGEAAARFIKQSFSVAAIGKRYGKRLGEVRARV